MTSAVYYGYKATNRTKQEALWPNGRALDSGARGPGSILTQVAVLFP